MNACDKVIYFCDRIVRMIVDARIVQEFAERALAFVHFGEDRADLRGEITEFYDQVAHLRLLSARQDAVVRDLGASETALHGNVAISEQTFGDEAGARIGANVLLELFLDPQDERYVVLVILRLRRQLNRLHAADLDAVEPDGRAHLQTFDFG